MLAAAVGCEPVLQMLLEVSRQNLQISSHALVELRVVTPCQTPCIFTPHHNIYIQTS